MVAKVISYLKFIKLDFKIRIIYLSAGMEWGEIPLHYS